MLLKLLLPDGTGLKLDQLHVTEESVTLVAQTTASFAFCPLCDQPSSQVHSRYERRLADLPLQGTIVRIQLRSRRFFCRNEDCIRKIFTERLPSLTSVHARCTNRLQETQAQIGFVLGGEAGSRLAGRLGLPTSGDTLLRRVRNTPFPDWPWPRIVGIDDWAWCKGTSYGTILCDLERGRPVDLLPDRNSDSVAAWLKAHPGIEVISRDRGGSYVQGAKSGAPQAVQVADRWHLLCNMRDVLKRMLECRPSDIKQAVQAIVESNSSVSESSPEKAPDVISSDPQSPAQEARQNRRLERYLQVKELHQEGFSIRGIACELHMNRQTVRKFLRAATFPKRSPYPHRPSQLDTHRDYIHQRWESGCHQATQITRELKERGFCGSYSLVQRYVGQLRRAEGTLAPRKQQKPTIRAPSPRRASWWLIQPPEKLSEQEQQFVEALCQRSDAIRSASELARDFSTVIRKQTEKSLADWLAQAQLSSALEVRGFVESIQQDQDAVEAAIALPWSNGPVEGQINRLKTLKRQMYGRAKFDLLRKRFLQAV